MVHGPRKIGIDFDGNLDKVDLGLGTRVGVSVTVRWRTSSVTVKFCGIVVTWLQV